MSDDWAKKYVEVHEQERGEKRQKMQEVQKRQGYAEAGAREKFHMLRERIGQDIQTLREDGTFQTIEVQDFSDGKFDVFHIGPPRVGLSIDLKMTTVITCDYTFFSKEGGRRQESKTLRICSDLEGHIAVYKNGGTDAFADESEASEFLLKPILKHISG